MSLGHFIALLVVGTCCALLAERVLKRHLPFGWIGAAVAGFLGTWLAVDVIHLPIAPTLALQPIPLVPALIGATAMLLLFSLVAHRGPFRKGLRR